MDLANGEAKDQNYLGGKPLEKGTQLVEGNLLRKALPVY